MDRPDYLDDAEFALALSPSPVSKRWPDPKPIPNGLLPVRAFDLAFLPESVAPWVADIAERMQCPLDFVAVPALVALGSVLGRKLAIRPQRKTDWAEFRTSGAVSSGGRAR